MWKKITDFFNKEKDDNKPNSKKTLKVELALTIVLCFTLVLSGISVFTGKSPLEILSIGKAGKVKGSLEGEILYKDPNEYKLMCGKTELGTYNITYTSSTDTKNTFIFEKDNPVWGKSQNIKFQLKTKVGFKINVLTYKIVNISKGKSILCKGTFEVAPIAKNMYPSAFVDINVKNTTIQGKLFPDAILRDKIAIIRTNNISEYKDINVDNNAPKIIKVSIKSLNKMPVVLVSAADSGELEGNIKYDIYKYDNNKLSEEVFLTKTNKYKLNFNKIELLTPLMLKVDKGTYLLKITITDNVGNMGNVVLKYITKDATGKIYFALPKK